MADRIPRQTSRELPRHPVRREARLDAFDICAADFPAGFRLPPHEHERPIFAVFLDGGMEVAFTNRRYHCATGTVQVHPAGERHSQRYPPAGASIVVIEPDPRWLEEHPALKSLLDGIAHFSHAGIETLARRARYELMASDSITSIALESIALDMFATAARSWADDCARRQPPPWLRKITDYLHANFQNPLRVTELAEREGVHPGHLARAFRQANGLTIGDYIRQRRLDWAADRLTSSDDLIADIAVQAGFADQSHLTRAFRRYRGTTPARCRKYAAH